MRRDANAEALQTPGYAGLQFCPKCERSRVMAIESIRLAIFHGSDVITYKCGKCGTEKTQIMN
jgi:ribosomal protein S27AE